MDKKELEALEMQLSCPEGIEGIEVAKIMQTSNEGMIRKTLDGLQGYQGNFLEIGPGNGAHVSQLYNIVNPTRYQGLEISGTMVEEFQASKFGSTRETTARIDLYDGEQIPFPDQCFNHGFTINTIYFWKNPVVFLDEIHRVLKPGGIFIITYVHKESMLQLPFVGSRFKLYEPESIDTIIRASRFEQYSTKTFTEEVRSKNEMLIQRVYSLVQLNR